MQNIQPKNTIKGTRDVSVKKKVVPKRVFDFFNLEMDQPKNDN